MNIIISGASKGIGAEIVKKLDAEGHDCLALSRDEELLLKLEKECQQLQTRAVDLNSNELSYLLLPILEKWKKIDVVINNAGQLINKPFIRTTSDDFMEQFQANVLTAVNLIQAATPFLVQGSHILNISSMGGMQGSTKFPGLSAYSSSKGALSVLTECLAEEYKELGIRVNALALGAVQTEMFEAAFPGHNAPLNAEEIGGYIAEFACGSHKFYNGQVLAVALGNP